MSATHSADAAAGARSRREPDRPDAAAGEIVDPLSGEIGYHLRLAQDASFRAFARRTGDPALKPGRFAALSVIRANPDITQIALSRAIARDKSTVTPLLQDLERLGLIRRLRGDGDRRSVRLRLTPEGEAMHDRLLAHAAAHDAALDAIVGAAKPEFLRLLRAIADRVG